MNNKRLVLLLCCLGTVFNAIATLHWLHTPQIMHKGNASIHANILKTTYFYAASSNIDSFFNNDIVNDSVISLPLADGSVQLFKIIRNALIPYALQAKFPTVTSYNLYSLQQASVTGKLERTPNGLHAMIILAGKVSFLDATEHAGLYAAHFKQDEQRPADLQMLCATDSTHIIPVQAQHGYTAQAFNNGYQLKTYRLALSCNNQYAKAATGMPAPTKAQVFAKMVTTINRINGVFERELSLTHVFVDKEDTLINVQEATDPFSTSNNDAPGLLSLNQLMCDSLIGKANYDIGHIFSTGGGGLSQVGCVCLDGFKAQSVTGSSNPVGDGFDIDYVVHEMGHAYGSSHTFNNNEHGSCSGNSVAQFAYEPGSGSTIMCYAGICSTDNIQPHSDDYFCASSLTQIGIYINNTGNTCPVKTPTNNKPVGIAAFRANYAIPYLTPFELIAPAITDSVADTLVTYCWEQHDVGEFGKSFRNTRTAGPIFRSYPPTKVPTRVFPRMDSVLAGNLSNVGCDNCQGEKAPEVARSLSFQLTVRSQRNGYGCFHIPDDTVHLDVQNTGEPFVVTSQAIKGMQYLGGSVQEVSWRVANTQTAPINSTQVNIYLSADGGYTYPYYLGQYPNNGQAVVRLPDTTIPNARIKVKGANNVFFNVNKSNFSIIKNPTNSSDILIFPNPGHHQLNIVTGAVGTVDVAIYQVDGRLVWQGKVYGLYTLEVALWPRGLYFLRMQDLTGNIIKRDVVLN